MFSYLLIIFAAFAGFLLAFYLHHKKVKKEAFVCPLRARCETVLHSDYSKFFGLPVELLGLVYYGAIALTYASMLIWREVMNPTVVLGALTATTAAFLFSMYLTFIQALALKQWCSWCLMSAGFCTIIFVAAVSVTKFGLVEMLEANHGAILFAHGVGAALGVGGATIADVFFFKFLKDFKISEWEAEALNTLAQVIWFALALLIVTGVGLYLPEAARLNETPKFLAKMIVVAVILVNGVALNLIISPRLVKISFGERHAHEPGELHHIRKFAFALGAISLASWYSAFLLGSLHRLDWALAQILAVYMFVLAAAVMASQVVERSLDRRARRRP